MMDEKDRKKYLALQAFLLKVKELADELLEKHFPAKLEETGIRIGSPGVTNVFGRKLDKSIAKCRRFWPHKTGTEGFFIAKLRK